MAPRFICNVCQKSLKTNQALKRHVIVHSKAKPYTCMYCSRRFGRDDTLSHHIKSCQMNMYNQWNYSMFTAAHFPNMIENNNNTTTATTTNNNMDVRSITKLVWLPT